MHKCIVFFDFDGVIVDSFNLAFQLIKLKNSNLTASEYRQRFEGNIYHYFNPDGSAANFKHSRSVLDFFKRYTPQVMHLEYLKGIDTVIQTLADAYTLAVVSSTPATTIREYLVLHKLDSYFTSILGPEVSTNKTEKIQDFLTETNTNPSQSVFITDTLGDIREATAAHVACIGVTWGYHPAATLKKGEPYAIISHPNEIVGAVSSFFNV